MANFLSDKTSESLGSSIRDLLNKITGSPSLDKEQAGHLRHFWNLAEQDGWDLMGQSREGEEFLDAYRYQLATIAYAVALTTYHRIPAAKGTLQVLMEKVIEKMLSREVWRYWYLTSQSGKYINPDIQELRKPWVDPVVRENIMYSGHLLLMVTLYRVLFNDDRYEKEGSITFVDNPIFYGFGPEQFTYNRASLQEAIIKEMQREGYKGVCCEPNNVFVVCNQFPLVAIMLNDALNNTSIFPQIIEEYKRAWEDEMLDSNGYIVATYRVQQRIHIPARSIGWTAWAGSMMNCWNPGLVRNLYQNQLPGWLSHVSSSPNSPLSLNPPPIAAALREEYLDRTPRAKDVPLWKECEISSRKAVEALWSDAIKPNGTNNGELASSTKLTKAALDQSVMPNPLLVREPVLGYLGLFLSEMGDKETLNGLFGYLDDHSHHREHIKGGNYGGGNGGQQKWEKGGLWYERTKANANGWDERGHHVHMDPFTGNAALGYARLNVKDGMKTLVEHPWSKSDHSLPYFRSDFLSLGLDVLRAEWVPNFNSDESLGTLILTIKRAISTASLELEIEVRNLLPGSGWELHKEKEGKVASGTTNDDGGAIVKSVELDTPEDSGCSFIFVGRAM